VAGCRKQEKKDKCEKSERLEWDRRNGLGERIEFENAENGIGISARVVGEYNENRMNDRENRHRYTGVPTVVKERKQSPVQPTQWADAKNDVQQNQRGRPRSTDEQDFIRDIREKDFSQGEE
jgi:hypothetical protein